MDISVVYRIISFIVISFVMAFGMKISLSLSTK
jgi:hypothetical protein